MLKIISTYTEENLIKECETWETDGWKYQGGICVLVTTSNRIHERREYYQAMVKDGDMPLGRSYDESERIRILKKAIGRFKAIIEGQECGCEENYTCTIHSDLVLANEAAIMLLGLGDNIE